MQCRKYEMNFGNMNCGSETRNTIHRTMWDIGRVRNVIQNDEIDRLRLQGPQVRITASSDCHPHHLQCSQTWGTSSHDQSKGNIHGSIASKKYMRNEIWSLISYLGAPSWFITFALRVWAIARMAGTSPLRDVGKA